MAAIIPVTPAPDLNSSATSYETINMDTNFMLSNIFYIRKKSYTLYLDAGKLVWERHKTKNG